VRGPGFSAASRGSPPMPLVPLYFKKKYIDIYREGGVSRTTLHGLPRPESFSKISRGKRGTRPLSPGIPTKKGGPLLGRPPPKRGLRPHPTVTKQQQCLRTSCNQHEVNTSNTHVLYEQTAPHTTHPEGSPNRGSAPPHHPPQTVLPKNRTPPTHQTPHPRNTKPPNPGNHHPRTRGIPHPAPYHIGMPWTTSDRHQRLPKHWNKTRKQILAKANYQCEGFTPPPPSPRPAGGGAWVTDPHGHLHSPHCTGRATDVDHIIPASQGGTDDPTNLRPLSHPCHTTATCAHNTARHTAIRAAATRPTLVHPGNIKR